MRDAMQAGTVRITGAGGDEIEAYLAQPVGSEPRGGVVVIHHMPGYDESTKEITRRLASYGYAAICPNLYSREAPGASPDDAAATARAAGGVPDDRLVGDVGGAADHLRGLPASNGKVGVIGYCSGGRQAFLAACRLPLDAAVDCYGAFVVGNPPENFPLAVTPLLDQAGSLSCPLLGMFGADDQYPSPAQVAELAGELTRLGKPHEFHSYPDAGHGFFAVDRPSYRPLAATEGWQRVREFFDRQLGA
ncbi:dienelactone hydrolase family protein [Plantactinospora soyae]|uniref:Carboxymethylenebutenolidase n=1 Tax=Plantactinospora soyae TaxID=1544732 RepID=A0A927M212_9ACTN|nr:dienelactone hydrolase family protein [Plantactinospora soyae]MBE1486652.1 carboxymethylenebutenolidase [Plantactinospora soyae]